ncbi:Methyltransferase-like protein [Melia azedarach]|uniref:Methyltransferase-like protein n=1 Tax=Melia azedarach TaxID=155640 RepID=A0ACC1XXK8_MELAZ|nr:Methyltransferase-like protein [Melia azedarach]
MDSEKVDCEKEAENNIQVEKVLHMTAGEGEYSYDKNALIQEKVISKAKHLIEASIVELLSGNECLKIADLGCSSGPKAYLPTWDVIESLHSVCCRLNHKPPDLQVFLNDFPGNDFNSTFKLLPSFYARIKRETGEEFGQCFVAAVPGSFYGRLFPPRSLHFVFSSYALHWLSQVPKGLVSESGISLNKENIYIAKTSPPSVHKAYFDQFEDDFTTFLKSRSEELKLGGRMVLALKSDDKRYHNTWDVFVKAINDLVLEGLIEESKLESFNVPYYGPSDEEIKRLVQQEGSFSIHKLETYYQNWYVGFDNNGNKLDYCETAKQMAIRFKAIAKPLVASHFGNDIVDEIYKRFSVKLIDSLETGLGVSPYLLISLIRK